MLYVLLINYSIQMYSVNKSKEESVWVEDDIHKLLNYGLVFILTDTEYLDVDSYETYSKNQNGSDVVRIKLIYACIDVTAVRINVLSVFPMRETQIR